jgi:nucleoside-diphosphate-sugar epimerase
LYFRLCSAATRGLLVDEPSHDRRRVLVTGAAGNVGRYVVRELARSGYGVCATDVKFDPKSTRACSRFAAASISPLVQFHPADLTDANEIATLLCKTQPQVVIHLAAVIPPYTYVDRDLSHRVNVEATRNLVRAAEQMSVRPYLLKASSMAVYGARNPHRHHGLLNELTPTSPTELYGAQKLAAEQIVRSSDLEWSILRLGGILSPDLSLSGDASLVAMEGSLPLDGRIQTVAVEDVAAAFERAVALRPVGEIFLIGGDDSHRLFQQEVGHGIAAAMGLRDVLPVGRHGNPEIDRDWFITDWLDTRKSQEVLRYQSRTFDDVLKEIRRRAGWRRWVLRLVSPIVRRNLARSAPYASATGTAADPWSVIASRWGWPLLEPDPHASSRQAHASE